MQSDSKYDYLKSPGIDHTTDEINQLTDNCSLMLRRQIDPVKDAQDYNKPLRALFHSTASGIQTAIKNLSIVTGKHSAHTEIRHAASMFI
jgi:hypothetical protein